MPLITPFLDTVRGYVRVEINWADTPAVQFARVLRVNPATGECVPLRPYVCFDGDYLKLSCGHGIFWDTEAPFDTEFYYTTDGIDAPCIPANPILFDTYTRTLVDSWGSPNLGPPYVLSGGTNPGNYDVNGMAGTQTNDSVNVLRFSTLDAGRANVDAAVTVVNPVLPLTSNIIARLAVRMTDTLNHYAARVTWTTVGRAQLEIIKVVAGVSTALAGPFALDALSPGNRIRVRIAASGPVLTAKAWNITAGQPEPLGWQLTVRDTTFTTGNLVAEASRLEAGNTNGTVVMSWDNLVVNVPCVPCVPVTATSGAVTLPSNGAFALGDPVRPCNDVRVPLCFTEPTGQPDCEPGSGIFFASMGEEEIGSNSFIEQPAQGDLPLMISRPTPGISSVLTLVTRTFEDLQALRDLRKPGSPLLLRAPQAPRPYGIWDQYMATDPLRAVRGLSDHRYPVRINELPYTQVRRTAGPSQGVCGSRVQDICQTWQELQDDGFTWDNLIQGLAGPNPPANLRRWTAGANSVLSLGTWNAVDNGTRTWTGLETGA